jgi:hypothetical protein
MVRPDLDRRRPSGGGLQFLDEGGGVGHDLDVVGSAFAEKHRHPRRTDFMCANNGAAPDREHRGARWRTDETTTSQD